MRRYVLLGVILLLLPATLVRGWPTWSDDAQTVLDLIRENYLEEVDLAACRVHILQGSLDKCLDRHSHLDPPPVAQLKRQEQSGAYGTITGIDGLGMVWDASSAVLAQAGLRQGDRLLEVNGRSLHGLRPEEVLLLLRGEPGSRVTVKVMRDGKTFSKELARHRQVIRTVHRASVSRRLGYIDLDSLSSKRTNEELSQALLDLIRVRRVRGTVVDVRGNHGGLVSQVLQAVREFTPAGDVIMYERGRNPRWDRTEKAVRNGRYRNLPVVVLQDGETASAAEFFSGALQLLGATVVGQQSLGKGVCQRDFTLPNGSVLWLTTSRWYFKDHRCIDGVGVTPDVPLDPKLTERQALAWAFKVLEIKLL